MLFKDLSIQEDNLSWTITWKPYLCSRVRGGSGAGEAGHAEGGGEGDGYRYLSGLQLVAGRTPTHPDSQRPALGEHTQTTTQQTVARPTHETGASGF